ncbi:PfkB family carbohydrate kinase [Bifidobacterium sp. ESL0728]|uniref:PfkB family carbohydrate kinase n=1 Tax=Bifidobacterium sp. ESL0728 TaxID=2983220 RepID=UPI0023F9BAF0|nr:PfkB family carbohydrate kinase [Bifidobacterium sp. ESL0728]WEV58772.1 PfkB family carbohydrate kinase [Bifidobacterium sp. ESL0728]
MREPELIHLAQVCVDLTLSVDHLPERGGDVFATRQAMSAGGGYNVLYAARQMGARASYLGAIGTGPMADVARKALSSIGVDMGGAVLPDIDTGYSIAMTEPDGERTFVSTRGAETQVPEDSYENIELVDGDVVYLCGYSFSHKKNTEAIRRFAAKNAGWNKGYVVFDTSPMIGDISDVCLQSLRRLHPIWTMNERETAILCSRFGLVVSSEDYADQCRALAEYFGDPVIVRVGALGAWYCDGRKGKAAEDGDNRNERKAGHGDEKYDVFNGVEVSAPSVIHIPALKVTAVDTNGAGDAHAGVLCAALLESDNIIRALKLANCAGGLSTCYSGPATSPSRSEIESAAKRLS